jgi:4-diphosphocytidyl-2-C-methyl-D-erythritol kinase
MRQITVESHAKINLTLDVVGRRDDGYHDIISVMQSIGLADRIRIRKNQRGPIFRVTNAHLPTDRRNLAFQAMEAICNFAGIQPQFEIILEKRIPVSAGLAGGSTNAAGVLKGINQLSELNVPAADLYQIAVALGSDVPFCMEGGTALAEGRGEILTPLKSMPDGYLVLFKPIFSVSTAQIYHQLVLKEVESRPDTSRVLEGIHTGNLKLAADGMGNVLEEVTFKMHPHLREYKSMLERTGCLCAMMSGSGPTLVAVTDTKMQADLLFQKAVTFPGSAFQTVFFHCGQEIY